MLRKNAIYWIWVSVIVFVLDQMSKYWILNTIPLNNSKYVLSFFNLTYRHNQGAAFSFLGGGGAFSTWLFSIVAIMVSIFILLWLYRLPTNKRWLACALAFVLGGAISNLFDRLMHGYVIDLLDFHIGTWHYATFNIADSAIVVGAIMLFIDAFFYREVRA